ncbi:hypothetical protein HRI_002764000 [Hibiscus trionum]|uniref:VQ domain-containing protein n=1 Tax=Hibiscus trionum TaxID=183268 RepID=A0A9W7M5R1_HIBTR|nr:hypothetical protein HRI_002764000 [Hibiscus trionum]
MDSRNSSSMQSWSDDEDGYESRTESVRACLNSNPILNPHPSLVLHHQSHPSASFDPCANFLNPFSRSQVEILSQRSEPNCTLDFVNLQLQGSCSSQGLISQGLYPSSSTSTQSRPSHDEGPRPLTKSDQKSAVKNPKKRTRASRTAPTTVLTTDTINFRAIVQEFTGIPAPPFSGSSYSPRLNLFGSGSGMRSRHLETLGSLYPQRPSAKRVKPTPIASSSSPSLLTCPLVDANVTDRTSNNTIPTSSHCVQLASESDLGILKQPQNMINLQNFQSFVHHQPLHPCLNLPGFAVSSHGSSVMSSLDELGFSPGNATAVGLNGGNQDHLRPLDWNYDSSDQNSQRV